jgi:hypothetical protein
VICAQRCKAQNIEALAGKVLFSLDYALCSRLQKYLGELFLHGHVCNIWLLKSSFRSETRAGSLQGIPGNHNNAKAENNEYTFRLQ